MTSGEGNHLKAAETKDRTSSADGTGRAGTSNSIAEIANHRGVGQEKPFLESSLTNRTRRNLKEFGSKTVVEND